MALNSNFYEEIFENEKHWTELYQKNLLNTFYLEKLKEFYLSKKVKLEQELSLSNNLILNNFLITIDEIIKQIDEETYNYRQGKKVNISSVVNLFIVNQMNNNNIDKNDDMELIKLQVRKQMLENLKQEKIYNDDYLYDDEIDDLVETNKKTK